MDAASIYTITPDEYPHGYHRAPSPATSLSPTLVNNVHSTERPSTKLRFPSGASNVLNSMVINAAGQSLYSISSNSKRTTLISCTDNVEIANVHWDCRSPRMVFRRKKTKCKYWLPRTGPENESRILTHGDSQFTWTHGPASGHLIPTNRPGLAVSRWYIQPHSNELILEIFQDTPVESGLLEGIVLSVVLLRSGRSLGDAPESVNFANSINFGVMSASLRP